MAHVFGVDRSLRARTKTKQGSSSVPLVRSLRDTCRRSPSGLRSQNDEKRSKSTAFARATAGAGGVGGEAAIGCRRALKSLTMPTHAASTASVMMTARYWLNGFSVIVDRTVALRPDEINSLPTLVHKRDLL